MKDALYIVLLLALLALTFWAGGRFNPFSSNPANYKKDSLVLHFDTIPVFATATPDIVIKEKTIEVPADVDTSAILQDYYTSRQYQSSYSDNRIKLDFKPSLSRNKLDSIPFSYQLLQPTEKHYYSNRSQNSLSAGALLAPGIGAATVSWQHKAWRFQAGYNFIGKGGLIGVERELINW